jgi:hypothetical protein
MMVMFICFLAICLTVVPWIIDMWLEEREERKRQRFLVNMGIILTEIRKGGK